MTKEQQSRIHLNILKNMLAQPETILSENNSASNEYIELTYENIKIKISTINLDFALLKINNVDSRDKYEIIVPLEDISDFSISFYHKLNSEYTNDLIERAANSKTGTLKEFSDNLKNQIDIVKEYFKSPAIQEFKEGRYTFRMAFASSQKNEAFNLSINVSHIYNPLSGIPITIESDKNNNDRHLFYISPFELSEYPTLKELVRTKLDFDDISAFQKKLTGNISNIFMNAQLEETLPPSQQIVKKNKI